MLRFELSKTELFDATVEWHGLGAPERRLLEAAALLHDTGWTTRPEKHHKGSRDFILESQMPGFGGDELKMIASPLEYIPAEPFDGFLKRMLSLLQEKEVDQIIVGMPRNMDGSHGPASEKVRVFIDRLRESVQVPIRTWDERLTSAQANRMLIQSNVRRKDRKQVVDKMAAAILLQSYLDSGAAGVLE